MAVPRVAIRDRGTLAAAALFLIAALSSSSLAQNVGQDNILSYKNFGAGSRPSATKTADKEDRGYQDQSEQVQRKDSAVIIRPISPDSLPSTLAMTNGAAPYHQTKSPWLAVGMSAVLPGSGQIYNEDYWKVPVIWGLGGYWIYEWVKLNNSYKDYRDQYDQSLVVTPPNGDPRTKEIRDFYHDERDKFAWFLGALYMVNLVDAYVGAHLYDFDVSGDLGLDGRIEPRVMATVHLRF